MKDGDGDGDGDDDDDDARAILSVVIRIGSTKEWQSRIVGAIQWRVQMSAIQSTLKDTQGSSRLGHRLQALRTSKTEREDKVMMGMGMGMEMGMGMVELPGVHHYHVKNAE